MIENAVLSKKTKGNKMCNTVTITTDVKIDVNDFLAEIDTYDLLDAFVANFDLDDIMTGLALRYRVKDVLDTFSIDVLKEYIDNRGGFTLENVSNEDLLGTLAERNIVLEPKASEEVTNALAVLNDHFGFIPAKRAADDIDELKALLTYGQTPFD